MRGVALLTAITFVAEIGDIRRFESPRQVMAYLGLVPSERSTGDKVRRGGITKAGNASARRVLIEGAWTYRYPARVSRPLELRQEGLSEIVRAIAWEGSGSLVCTLPAPDGGGQAPDLGHHSHRARDGGFSLGDRTRSRAAPRRLDAAGRNIAQGGSIPYDTIAIAWRRRQGPRWGTLV